MPMSCAKLGGRSDIDSHRSLRRFRCPVSSSPSRSATSTPSTPSRPGWPRPGWPRWMSARRPAATPSRTSSGCRARPTASHGRSTRFWATARRSMARRTGRPAAARVRSQLTRRPPLLPAAERGAMTEVPQVLFVCVHNAGRSQMAAALLDDEARGRVRVTSAGSQPASQINPAVVQAMAEIGLDLSREFPKPLTGDQVQAADVVVTMGCGDACPFYPGKRYLDWDLPDPAGLDVTAIRPIRDDIRHRVRGLLSELSLG